MKKTYLPCLRKLRKRSFSGRDGKEERRQKKAARSTTTRRRRSGKKGGLTRQPELLFLLRTQERKYPFPGGGENAFKSVPKGLPFTIENIINTSRAEATKGDLIAFGTLTFPL